MDLSDVAVGRWEEKRTMADLQTLLSKFLNDLYAGTLGVTLPITSVTTSGAVIAGGEVSGLNLLATSTGTVYWSGRSLLKSPSDGNVSITNQAATIGSQIKVDALPTVASGFGTSPAVTAGSTPLAGSVNIGTGGVATSGVINFNGTAFPSAPFVVCMNTTTGAVVRATATTTQLTITAPAAFVASDVITWICISAK